MNPTYRIARRIFTEMARGFYDYRALGLDNIRFPGPAIIVSNHISYFDPPLVGLSFHESIYFLARKSLMSNPLAAWIYTRMQAIPVDQEKPDPGSLKKVFRVLSRGHKIVIFPTGTRELDGSLGKAEAGTGLIIAKARVPVIPARIFGAYEALPYGAKFPVPSRITVVYGKPYTADLSNRAETGRELYQKLSDEAMERIAELGL